MVGVTGAIIGSAVIGGVSSTISGNKAAKAQRQAADKSAETERYMYDTTRADFAPYRQVGQGALYKLADMYGVSRPVDQPARAETPTNPAMSGIAGMWGFNAPSAAAPQPQQQMTPGFSGFEASPGYQFRLSEGLKATERSAAARGGLRSGATLKALQRYGEGLASSEYENYANRLAAMAGIGQSATGSTAAAGAQAAGGISSAYQNAGNARASAYQNTGNAINQTVGNLAGAYLYNKGFGSSGGAYGIPGSGGIY